MCRRYHVPAIFQLYIPYIRVILFESRSLMVFRIYAKIPIETLRCVRLNIQTTKFINRKI